MKYLTILPLIISFNLFSQIPTDALVAFYPFNNNTLDSSGLSNDAIAGGCSFAEDRFGNENAALLLNGISDSLIIPIDDFTPLTGDFTFSFWLKTSSPETMNIFSIKEAAHDTINNFEIQLNGNSILQTIPELYYASFIYWNGSGWVDNRLAEGGPGQYHNGQWHHFVVKRNSDTIQFWHDRVLYHETYYWGTIGDAIDLVVGSLPHRFNGTIDDIAIYDKGLNQSEIHALFHDHKPFHFVSPRSTDAYIQNDTAYVFWYYNENVVSDSVLLEYQLNSDGIWLLSDQNQLTEWTPYYFPLPYTPGTTIELRITDKLNPEYSGYVGKFIISEYQWENVSPELPFTARDGSGLLNFKDKMWLIGGWDPPYHEENNYTCSEIYSSTDGANFTFETEAPWLGRHVSGWLVHDNFMWVIGGDPQSGALSDIWKSADGINWIKVLDSIPGFDPPRTMHMVASLNGNILNFGGQPFTGVFYNLNQVWQSADGESWTQLPDAPWNPRGMVGNSCVDDEGFLWLMGGGRLNDRRYFNDVWKTNNGIDWQLINPAAPWGPRYWHNVAYFDNKIWVVCGIENQTDDDETWYSENGIDWHELKNPPYVGRHAGAVTVYNNALWMMTGIVTNDSWKLTNVTATSINDPLPETASKILFPNPATNKIYSKVNIRSATIYSVNGVSVPIKFDENTINIENLIPGIYLVSIITRNGELANEIIVIQ